MFEEEKKTKTTKSGGSGSHICCVSGCSNPGTVCLGSIKPDEGSSWKCSFHQWGRQPDHKRRDWRDILVDERILGQSSTV